MGVENSYNCMGVPRTFGRHCSNKSYRKCYFKQGRNFNNFLGGASEVTLRKFCLFPVSGNSS